jgi:uncharacterized membrane protein
MILDPSITERAEIMESNANSRVLLDANDYNLNDMGLYWNVGLLIMHAPDAKICHQQLMDAFTLNVHNMFSIILMVQLTTILASIGYLY